MGLASITASIAYALKSIITARRYSIASWVIMIKPGIRRFEAVSAVIINNGDILLLRRSDRVRTNRGKWSVVSGEVEPSGYLETAFSEILQETGISKDRLKFLRSARGLKVKLRPDSETVVYPFLFESSTRDIMLNDEHTEYVWIKPEKVSEYDTVPKFQDLLRSLLP